MKKLVICMSFFAAFPLAGAMARIASQQYVDETRANWTEADNTRPTFIDNKPEIATEIADTTPADALATVGATKQALTAKADTSDARFDTVPTSRPDTTPQSGRAMLWIE